MYELLGGSFQKIPPFKQGFYVKTVERDIADRVGGNSGCAT